MALNPFFLQGSKGEQTLLQELSNEMIRMHGIEFIYMPRVLIKDSSVMREITSSKFDRSFPIEGYIASYEGFDSNYNLLTKFGVRSTAEMKIIISIDRYENSIAPLLWKFPTAATGPTGRAEDQKRPFEGDLIYFPLRDIIFEIKYVNDLENFYQLQDRYTYELTCEPFEYSDEVINTGVGAIDDDFDDEGYNVTMILGDAGARATASSTIVNNGVYKVDVLNGGTGYTVAPTVKIDPPVGGGVNASAVAITSTTGTRNFKSLRVESIRITNPGAGYTMVPNVQFLTEDGKGSGASGLVGVGTVGVIQTVTVNFKGIGYYESPLITVSAPPAGGVTGILTAKFNTTTNQIDQIDIINAGYGYTVAPTITVAAASTIGSGTFQYGEIITGQSTLTTAFVTKWDTSTNTLLARNLSGNFGVGEQITNVGYGTAVYTLDSIDYSDDDAYETGDTIQTLTTTSILDFTEKNPFGEV
tara:strand:+ start:729 stop:2144 length:1416 start_codon:yes stop_codon:yes gene_type:complete